MKARRPGLSLAAVRGLRLARAPVTAEDLAAPQTDVLAGYVFAQAAAGAGEAWQEAAARGSRASSCLLTSHFGPTPAQADNCILHYYNWLGDIARQIAAGAPHQHRYGQGSRRCVRVAGGDELIFIRATASPGQLELLAGAVP